MVISNPMKVLYFDIETLPASEESFDTLRILFNKKMEKKAKQAEILGEVVAEVDMEKSFDDYVKGTSFDGAYGRVLCIAYAVNDDEVRVLCNPENEQKPIEDFWFVARQCDLFVGHNIMDFDLRFLLQRSMVLKVKPSWQRFGKKDWNNPDQKYLSFARYQHMPIFDTMHEWAAWGGSRGGGLGLEHIALAMGIPSPKDGIDGSQVFEFYKAGKVKEICEYCKRDVDTTRSVYKRMVFED